MRTFKTGPLGLSDQEIDKEKRELFVAMCKRNNLDPDDSGSQIGCGCKYTPTEIHREQVLWAMKMANTILCYDGAFHGKSKWDTYAYKYQTQQAWDDRGYGPVRKFGFNKVQNEAYHLTQEETDAIWKAQGERISKAKILTGVHTDEDGFSYNAVQWDAKAGK